MTTALAACYAGLANADASDTLRSASGAMDVPLATPCAVVLLANLAGVGPEGSTWLTGTAEVDALVMLDPSADLPRRYAAMLRWLGPALTATMPGVQLGLHANISGAVPSAVEVALAGDSAVYAGLPYDLVRVRYSIPFRDRVTVLP